MNAINWRELLAALRVTHRMTLGDIATAVGTHRDSIKNYYRHATTPSHLTGEKLIALWLSTTGKPRDLLPTERVIPSVSRIRRQ